MTPTQLLAYETAHPHDTPARREHIRITLGITEIRYALLLDRAARTDEGMRAYPITARQVRETAERRAQVRADRSGVRSLRTA